MTLITGIIEATSNQDLYLLLCHYQATIKYNQQYGVGKNRLSVFLRVKFLILTPKLINNLYNIQYFHFQYPGIKHPVSSDSDQ